MATKKKGKDTVQNATAADGAVAITSPKSAGAQAKAQTSSAKHNRKQDSKQDSKQEKLRTQTQKPEKSEQKKDMDAVRPNNKAKGKGKKQDSAAGEGNSLAHFIQFLKEVNVEFGKITWPDRSVILRETWGVLLLVTVLTFLVLGFDWTVGRFVFQPLEHWARLMGGGVGHQ